MNSLNYPKTILIITIQVREKPYICKSYSCANHGKKTILIDFDLRRPGIHKFCNITNESGLLTLINHAGDSSEGLQELAYKTLTQIHPNLFVLPSGKARAATDCLKGEYERVLFELRKMADVIIIDSPPIGFFLIH